MSSQQAKQINRFRSRLELIDNLAGKWQTHFSEQTRVKVPGNKALADMLNAFRLFAWEYFIFLAKGESQNPIAYDLSRALGNLQEEWKVLNYVCEQRMNEQLQTKLKNVTKVAQKLYQQFQGFRPTNAMPIIYFDRLFAIRRFAFTPFPLISIPLQIFNEPDYLNGGVAHELGHYVYHNSVPINKYQDLHSRLQSIVLQALPIQINNFKELHKQAKIAEIWLSWLEETFADICGTLIVGPAYVKSGQQLFLESTNSADERSEDDGAHPAPYLRPFIAIETLAWVQAQLEEGDSKVQQLQAVIAQLRENWADIRRQGRRQEHNNGGTPSGLKMREIEDQLKGVVWTILGDGSSGSWLDAQGKFTDLGTLFDYTPWLNNLAAFITESVAEAVAEPKLNIPADISGTVSSFSKLRQFLEDKHGGDANKKVRETLLSLDLSEESPYRCHSRYVKWVGYRRGNYRNCS
jgi:hypothetical protein